MPLLVDRIDKSLCFFIPLIELRDNVVHGVFHLRELRFRPHLFGVLHNAGIELVDGFLFVLVKPFQQERERVRTAHITDDTRIAEIEVALGVLI